MADVNTALAASKEAIEQMIQTSERCGPAWAAPRAPGKWSPSQIVEHVARSLEESANMAAGRQSKFPSLPALVHPIVRGLLFKRVLQLRLPFDQLIYEGGRESVWVHVSFDANRDRRSIMTATFPAEGGVLYKKISRRAALKL